MNRLLKAATKPVKTWKRTMQIARGYLYRSEAGIARNAAALWARSTSDELIRDLSHWRGEGRCADEDNWDRLGQRHFKMFEKLCLLADVTQPIQSLVEWGPGGGANAVWFCAKVPIFYGVDISPANLAECQRQVESRSLQGFRPILIDIDKLEQCLELVEEPVDFFLSTAVYQHFPAKEYGIRVTELAARLLADEGVALIQIRYDDGSPQLKAKKRNYEKNVVTFTSYDIHEFWQIAIDVGMVPLAVNLNPKVAYAYFFLKKGGPNG